VGGAGGTWLTIDLRDFFINLGHLRDCMRLNNGKILLYPSSDVLAEDLKVSSLYTKSRFGVYLKWKLMKTIKVDDLGYGLIETARKLLEDMWPFPVTQGLTASLGVILLLQKLGQAKAQMQGSPQGQVYLKLIEVLKAESGRN